jgi:hypothetical protein
MSPILPFLLLMSMAGPINAGAVPDVAASQPGNEPEVFRLILIPDAFEPDIFATVFIGSGRFDRRKRELTLNGPVKAFYGDGRVKMEGVFRNNKGIGDWKYYGPNGEKLAFAQLPGATVHEGAAWLDIGYPQTGNFVMRKKDPGPIFYYHHCRRMLSTLSKSGRLLLIHDFNCTDCLDVYVLDLETMKRCDIRRIVDGVFRKYAKYFTHASMAELSPDERRIMISVSSIVSDRERQENGGVEIVRTYVLDSHSGKILHEYANRDFPEKWWEYQPTSRKEK